MKSEDIELLGEHREHAAYAREDIKERFLVKYRLVRIIIHILLDLVALGVGIWILYEVGRFYNTAYSIANQSGYKGDLQVHFLDACQAVGYVLIIVSAIGVIFGVVILVLDKKIEKHPLLGVFWPAARWIVMYAIIFVQAGTGFYLWRKGEDKHPSMEVAALAGTYTGLPTQLTSEGSVSILTATTANMTVDPAELRSTIILNALQIMMKCCGTESGYKDFRSSPYFFETFPVFAPPVFCCNFENSIQRTLKDRSCYSVAMRLSDITLSNAHKGCIAAVADYRRTYFPIMFGIIFGVVCLKFIVHLVECLTECFRSDSVWTNARSQCNYAIDCLKTRLTLDRVAPPNTEFKESYRENMSRLDELRGAIAVSMNSIIGCLRSKQPGMLSEEYNKLERNAFSLVTESSHSMWRICQTRPFHTVKPFGFQSSEKLMYAIHKMRKSCEVITATPTLRYVKTSQLHKRLLRGALCLYQQCTQAAREAATAATFETFAELAQGIITACGALLSDLQSASLDETMMRNESERLSEVGKKIGNYFTADGLLTLTVHPRQQEAEHHIKRLTQDVVDSIIAFLTAARTLTVPEVGSPELRAHQQSLGRHQIAALEALDVLCACIEHTVPGVMDCTAILQNIDSMRTSNWRQLNDLADQTRPLADFCVLFFDVSKMQSALDRIAWAVRKHQLENTGSKRSRDMIYKVGRHIIELDSRRRFLQLETCGLASTTIDLPDGQKMVDTLFVVLENYYDLLQTCQMYLTSTKENSPLKSQAEVFAIESLTTKIKDELDSLSKLHNDILRNRGYKFCSTPDEAGIATDDDDTHGFSFTKLIRNLPKELFLPYPERSSDESDPDPISTSDFEHETPLEDPFEITDDIANRNQFNEAVKDINKRLRTLRYISALYEVKRSDLANGQREYFSAARLTTEVGSFWDHVDELITAAKKNTDSEALHVVYFSVDAVKRLCDACEAAAKTSWQRDERRRILAACLNVGASYSELLDFIDRKFRDADQDVQPVKLESIRAAIKADLRLIMLTERDRRTPDLKENGPQNIYVP